MGLKVPGAQFGNQGLLYSWFLALLQFCFLLAPQFLFLFISCSQLPNFLPPCPGPSSASSPPSGSSLWSRSGILADQAAVPEALIWFGSWLWDKRCALNLSGLLQFSTPERIMSVVGSLSGMPVMWLIFTHLSVGMPSTPVHLGYPLPYSNKELAIPHRIAPVIGMSSQKRELKQVSGCGLWVLGQTAGFCVLGLPLTA